MISGQELMEGAEARHAARQGEMFGWLDADSDGSVSEEEFAQMHAGRGMRGGFGPGRGFGSAEGVGRGMGPGMDQGGRYGPGSGFGPGGFGMHGHDRGGWRN